jgi:hypothetical protein
MANLSGFGARRRSLLQRAGLAFTTLTALSVLVGLPSTAQAKARGRHKAAGAAREAGGPAGGKIAVFAFDGDDFTNVRKHVIAVLSNQGLQVDTSLKPVQTAVEFRDMGATLDLVAYVHGHIKELPNDKAEATIVVRSGVTGRSIATATIAGYRRGIRFDVEEKLWSHVGKAIKQACQEATKPRRPVNAPTRIEAGTPL